MTFAQQVIPKKHVIVEQCIRCVDYAFAQLSHVPIKVKRTQLPQRFKGAARDIISNTQSIPPAEITNIIDKNEYQCISFDVFDTLVTRALDKPQDLFVLLERDFNQNYNSEMPFARLRMEAESNAQQLANSRQVTLREIYESIAFLNSEQKDWALAREIELEIMICCARPSMKDVWNWCLDKQLILVVASDTYLPKNVIDTILRSCGYSGWSRLFVSSETGCRKVTGELFPLICDDINTNCGVESRNICHIGDSLKSDWIAPKKQGMKRILIPRKEKTCYMNKKMRRWSTQTEVFEYSIINNFIASNMPRDYGFFERVGYETLGPILLGFSKWLAEEMERNNITKAFFLTREGSLLKTAFELYCGKESNVRSTLLNVSRRATSNPLLSQCSSIDEAIQLTRIPRAGAKVSNVLSSWGLSDSENALICESAGIQPDSNIKTLDKIEKQLLFDAAYSAIIDNASRQRTAINAYLESQSFSGTVAVIDIGWFGTIQSNLQAIRPDCLIDGYYVAKKRNYGGVNRPEREHFFLYDSMYSPVGEILTSAVEVFELLFLSNEGTTIGYDISSDGTAYPIKAEPERKGKNAESIMALQTAALHFVSDFRDLSTSLNLDLSANSCSAAYCRFIASPTKEMIDAFGKFSGSDTGVEKHVVFATGSIFDLIFHPKKFFETLRAPGSKGLFLKSVFKVPLPWPHILSLLRKLDGQMD